MTTQRLHARPCLRISWAANTPLADMGETLFPTRASGIPGLGLHLVVGTKFRATEVLCYGTGVVVE